MLFTNTSLFSETANYYKKYGRYNDGDYGSTIWREFWEEEKKRCKFGYTIGDTTITGRHYFYLNHWQIELISKREIEGIIFSDRKPDFPRFWDEDYNFFWLYEIAKKGITKQKYNDLGLSISIREDHLKGGKHVLYLKPRGCGASNKYAGGIAGYNYTVLSKTRTIMLAEDKTFLVSGDGVLDKFNFGRNFINSYGFDNLSKRGNSAFFRNQLKTVEDKMFYKNGFLRNGIERGKLCEVMGVTLNNDPNKHRGKRALDIYFEELGKFANADLAWEVSRPSVEEGEDVFGTLLGAGTGGVEGASFASMEKMFYEPDSYNVIAVHNDWDEGCQGTFVSFFTPAYKDIGFVDKDGNSQQEKAKRHYDSERRIAAKSTDSTLGIRKKSEKPYNPREAMLNTSTNPFMSLELNNHFEKIQGKKRENNGMGYGIPIDLFYSDHKIVGYKPNFNKKPLDKYPLENGDKMFIDGCVSMYQPPFVNAEGKTPDNMYIVCVDPFKYDEVKFDKDMSLGCIHVIENPNKFSRTKGDSIVATYVGRPNSNDDFNEILFKLAYFYNAKVGFEDNVGDTLGFAKRKGYLDRLEPSFTFGYETNGKSNGRGYGMTMNGEKKNKGILYLKDFIYTERGTFENGEKLLNLHLIYDLGLLQELMKYNDKGNFDRISALIIGMFHKKEIDYQNREVATTESDSAAEFFNMTFFGNQPNFA